MTASRGCDQVRYSYSICHYASDPILSPSEHLLYHKYCTRSQCYIEWKQSIQQQLRLHPSVIQLELLIENSNSNCSKMYAADSLGDTNAICLLPVLVCWVVFLRPLRGLSYWIPVHTHSLMHL